MSSCPGQGAPRTTGQLDNWTTPRIGMYARKRARNAPTPFFFHEMRGYPRQKRKQNEGLPRQTAAFRAWFFLHHPGGMVRETPLTRVKKRNLSIYVLSFSVSWVIFELGSKTNRLGLGCATTTRFDRRSRRPPGLCKAGRINLANVLAGLL